MPLPPIPFVSTVAAEMQATTEPWALFYLLATRDPEAVRLASEIVNATHGESSSGGTQDGRVVYLLPVGLKTRLVLEVASLVEAAFAAGQADARDPLADQILPFVERIDTHAEQSDRAVWAAITDATEDVRAILRTRGSGSA